MRIAVIPARGGSKRIPRKNIRPFCGKPMMAWSIDAARNSGLFDHVLVSTDDPEISAIAVEYGAEAPFARPAELADDHAGTSEVIAHATRWARERGWSVEAVCCIYATAPFVETVDIRRGLQELEAGNWDFAFSATDFPAPIFRALKRRADGGVEMFFPEHFLTRSQDLPLTLHDAAQFYWGRPAAWIEGERIFGPRSVPIMVPRWRVQDIDNEDDWARAEILAPLIMHKQR